MYLNLVGLKLTSMGQVIQTQNCSGRLFWWLESRNGYNDPKKVCGFFQASLLLSLYVFVECLAEILACSHHQFPMEITRETSNVTEVPADEEIFVKIN